MPNQTCCLVGVPGFGDTCCPWLCESSSVRLCLRVCRVSFSPLCGAYVAPASYLPPAMVGGVPPGVGGYNAVQYPTVWNGDHVLSGSEGEWAREDAAQHALNLADWRIKILQVPPTHPTPALTYTHAHAHAHTFFIERLAHYLPAPTAAAVRSPSCNRSRICRCNCSVFCEREYPRPSRPHPCGLLEAARKSHHLAPSIARGAQRVRDVRSAPRETALRSACALRARLDPRAAHTRSVLGERADAATCSVAAHRCHSLRPSSSARHLPGVSPRGISRL